jgi:thioredoxin reductase (NADPH)
MEADMSIFNQLVPYGARYPAAAQPLPLPLLDDGDPSLFPKLTETQLQLLTAHGEVRSTEVGQVLFGHGDSDYDAMVVLKGTVSVVARSGGQARELVLQRPGDLMVELNLFTGQGSAAEGIVREAGSVLAIPGAEFRALVERELEFGSFVLQTLFRRRQALQRLKLGVRIVGSQSDRDAQRLREFAIRNRVLHEWLDIDDPGTRASLAELGIDRETPVVLLDCNRFLSNPTDAEFAASVGLHQRMAADPRTFDVVVVGGGPGGLAAAVYAAAGGLSTALLDATALGGQAATSARIENYLGFPAGVSGAELTARAQLQAVKFGAEIIIPGRAVALAQRDGMHVIELDDGRQLLARGVILALGVQYRRLPIPGLGDYEGRGVSYAVDVARAQLAPGDPAVVVGGANSAGQAALTLAEEGHHVNLVVRGAALAGSMARYLRDRIATNTNIAVMLGSEVRTVDGKNHLEHVTIEKTATGQPRTLDARAMVVLIGAEPPTEWLAAELDLDDDGFVLTGPALDRNLGQQEPWKTLGREPFLVETSRPGVFAIGDVRSGSTKMVAPAAGEGGMAVRLLGEHLARTRGAESRNAEAEQARPDPSPEHHQRRRRREPAPARSHRQRSAHRLPHHRSAGTPKAAPPST